MSVEASPPLDYSEFVFWILHCGGKLSFVGCSVGRSRRIERIFLQISS